MLPPLHEWESFYVIVGSSAAALTGLMFVVVTLSAERRAGGSGAVRAFGTPTIVHFGAVLLLAAIMTSPGHTPGSLTVCFLVTALGGLAYAASAAIHMRRQTDYAPVTSDTVWHVVLPALSYVFLFAGSLVLRAHPEAALRMVALVSVALLFIGIHNSWDSAVWISTQHSRE
jgi:hypothetical protein